MQKSLFKSMFVATCAALALAAAPSALAQLVTSGITGLVYGSDGKAVAGANVTAVYTPTNATFRAVSNDQGRFNFRGLPVGGPYTVSAGASGYSTETESEVYSQLGVDIDVSLTLKSDVIQLEAFVATASRTDLDATASGAGTVLNSQRLNDRPTSERSLADMISATPMVTLRSTFGDREESQITAVGQNNRYNSIQIDGARINDQFGLNGTGLASFFNPLSLDTLEQLSVAISPYDVRQAGFTGASINAVTKSGTNKFKGSVYTYFRGDHLWGQRLHGYNARENSLTGTKVIPFLERQTWGVTLGGPILRDKLFFFVSYEKFDSSSAGRDPRFTTSQEAAVLARLQKYSTDSGKAINWGSAVTSSTTNAAEDEKIIAKLDWQINENHRASVRYSTTEGMVPQFGNFASGTVSLVGVNGGITTSPDGHFYSQSRKEKAVAGQLFSQWTPDFKTEVKYSQTKQDQLTPLNSVAPMLVVTGLTGVDNVNNTNVTNGSYVAGTEQFRHGNVIAVDSKQMNVTAEYFWRNFVFTGGIEREESDFYNLFRNGSFGLVAFRNYNDFLNDTNVVIQRNVYDPSRRPVADLSDFATTGLFAQAKWDVSNRLNIAGGVRYEFQSVDAVPAFNAPLQTAAGFNNTGTPDGVGVFSPRLGFNYSLNQERSLQLRGGIGHFSGRAPWVFFSNSFNNIGVGSFTQFNSGTNPALPTTLTAYLRDRFDPANPIGTATDDGTGRREVNWSDAKVKMPSSWRGNLAVEQKLGFLDSVATLEVVHSIIDQALFIRNENLRPTTVGLDGRQRFAGNPGTTANAQFAGFTDLYHISNVSTGKSTYVTFSWDRPMKNKWGFNFAYTRGKSTEAQAIGQTTASGQWQRNVVFNQSTVETGTSDFEIKDRVQLTLTKQLNLFRDWRTTVSMYYEGRTGNPHSWVYGSDLNGDGRTDNDTVAVPSGTADARFDFSGLTSAQTDAYFAFLSSSGLSAYAGGIAPKNAFNEPWVNRLDLKFQQEIKLYDPVKLSLFLDFINFGGFISKSTFGYTETAPGISNDVFRRRFLSNATYGTDGRIRPAVINGGGYNIDNGMTRWRIQVGAKLEF